MGPAPHHPPRPCVAPNSRVRSPEQLDAAAFACDVRGRGFGLVLVVRHRPGLGATTATSTPRTGSCWGRCTTQSANPGPRWVDVPIVPLPTVDPDVPADGAVTITVDGDAGDWVGGGNRVHRSRRRRRHDRDRHRRGAGRGAPRRHRPGRSGAELYLGAPRGTSRRGTTIGDQLLGFDATHLVRIAPDGTACLSSALPPVTLVGDYPPSLRAARLRPRWPAKDACRAGRAGGGARGRSGPGIGSWCGSEVGGVVGSVGRGRRNRGARHRRVRHDRWLPPIPAGRRHGDRHVHVPHRGRSSSPGRTT